MRRNHWNELHTPHQQSDIKWTEKLLLDDFYIEVLYHNIRELYLENHRREGGTGGKCSPSPSVPPGNGHIHCASFTKHVADPAVKAVCMIHIPYTRYFHRVKIRRSGFPCIAEKSMGFIFADLCEIVAIYNVTFPYKHDTTKCEKSFFIV